MAAGVDENAGRGPQGRSGGGVGAARPLGERGRRHRMAKGLSGHQDRIYRRARHANPVESGSRARVRPLQLGHRDRLDRPHRVHAAAHQCVGTIARCTHRSRRIGRQGMGRRLRPRVRRCRAEILLQRDGQRGHESRLRQSRLRLARSLLQVGRFVEARIQGQDRIARSASARQRQPQHVAADRGQG